MNKQNASISIILAMLMIATPLSVFVGISSASDPVNNAPLFAGGDGSIGNPWQIATVIDLQAMNTDLNAHYILNNDIDANVTSTWNSGAGFEPVGDHTTQFTGTFDGQGYTISNLYINRPGGNPVGLFGRPGAGSYIGNVSLTNANITGGANTAILVGYNEGTVDNCSVYGIIDGSDNTGGVIGTNAAGSTAINCFSDIIIDAYSGGGIAGENRATVMDCLSYGSVSGVNNVGGLVGLNSGPIHDSFSYVDVFSSEKVAGGLVGSNGAPNGIIENCSAYGDVHVDTPSLESDSYAGGLVGSNTRPINNSSAHGNVYGNKNSIGGLVGKNWASGTIATSYATGSVNDLRGEVAHWKMDEAAWTGAADEVLDSSGNGNHGTAVNGPTTVPGKFGLAGNFSMTSLQHVDVPDDPSLNITKNITVSVWVNTAYTGFLQTIVGKDDDGPGGRSWHLCIQNTHVRFNVWTPTQTQLVGSINVSTGTWRHIAATYDGNEMRIYVDGVLDTSTPKTGDIAAIVEPVQIGCMNNGWYFDGMIDDARIYNRALSPNEIYSFNCDNVGGLVGDNGGNIDNCYSSGSVTGNNGVGGLVGINSGTVTDSAWDNETSGLTTSAAGIGLNTTLMMMNTTFITAGWDFTNTWWMLDNETRPFLRMEYNTTIRNSHQVQLMQLDLAADYTVANDIDMDCANPANMWGTSVADGKGFLPIGNATSWFTGSLNGNENIVAGLFINRSSEDNIGLLGRILTPAEITNITLSDVNITGGGNVGALVGYSSGGIIKNSHVACEIWGNTNFVGGLVGYSSLGSVDNSSFDGNVTASVNYVGGLIGRSTGPVTYCSSSGIVDGGSWVGGLIGDTLNSGSVENCSSSSTVDGNTNVGGLIGLSNRPVNNSYAYGNVSGNSAVGGLVGYNANDIDYSNSSGAVNGNQDIGGLIGNHNSGNIRYCNATGDVNGTGDYVGGFVGQSHGPIYSSYATGYVTGDGYVGGLIGYNSDIVTDCWSSSAVTGKNIRTGGLIGYNDGGQISDCYATGDVNGTGYVGGLSGYHGGGGTITTSFSTGEVIGTGNLVGGFVGYQNGAPISNCYAWGDVTGDQGVGGFMGGWGGNVDNCYSIGNATGNTDFAGFYGTYNSGTITECHWDVMTSGTSNGVGDQPDPAGLEGNDTTEMMQQATFTNWDFTNIWGIYEHNSYPFLRAMGPTYVPSADLNLTIESSPYPIAQNGSFVYIYVNVTNNGPDNAVNVNVTVTGAGADMELNSANQTVVQWDSGASWYPSLLGPGETAWLLVNLTANESSMFFLNGTSTSDVADPVLDNNNDGIILSINDAPIAANDPNKIIDEDSGPINMDVLLNDNDPDGDDLTVISVTQGVHGTVAIIDAGKNVTYEPDLNWNGDDWFNYTISDGRGGTDTATVNVTVTSVNDAPTASDDTATVAEDSGANVIDVLANDADTENDTLEITVVTQGTHGTVVITGGGTGLTYEPDADFFGTDTFTYTIHDGNNGTDIATVDVTVTNVNDAPVITTADVTAATEDVLYNVDYDATDADLDTLTWSLETDAGWLSIDSATGVLSGTPVNADVGTYWVNITVDDGNGGTDRTNFTLTVSNTNDAPVISTTTALDGTAGEPYSLQVNATDDDGDTLTWGLETNATWLSINTTGWLTGTPDAAGTFWVNVSVDDGNGGTDSVNLTITIASTQADNDTDGDGVPDDQDDFPNDATEDTDTDGDGTGDNADAFPDDIAASVDADGDGAPDEWNDGYTADDSTTGLVLDDDVEDADADNDAGSSYWLYIIIILVIVGIVGAALMMKNKGPKPEPVAPVEEIPSEEAEPMDAPEEAVEPETVE